MGTSLIKDTYQSEYCTSSDSSTIFTSSRRRTVAVCGKPPCVAYIVVLTLTAHHQFSIAVTVRLTLVYTINEIV